MILLPNILISKGNTELLSYNLGCHSAFRTDLLLRFFFFLFCFILDLQSYYSNLSYLPYQERDCFYNGFVYSPGQIYFPRLARMNLRFSNTQ